MPNLNNFFVLFIPCPLRECGAANSNLRGYNQAIKVDDVMYANRVRVRRVAPAPSPE